MGCLYLYIIQNATEASKDKFQACFQVHHDIPFAHITVHHDMLESSLHIALLCCFDVMQILEEMIKFAKVNMQKSNINEIQGLRHNMPKAECIVPCTDIRTCHPSALWRVG